MCCHLTIELDTYGETDLRPMMQEFWGWPKPKFDWKDQADWPYWLRWGPDENRGLPERTVTHREIHFAMEGEGHDVTVESWIKTVKCAVSTYEELRRRGIRTYLAQQSNLCGTDEFATIADGGDVDLTKLCRAALEGHESAPDGRERP